LADVLALHPYFEGRDIGKPIMYAARRVSEQIGPDALTWKISAGRKGTAALRVPRWVVIAGPKDSGGQTVGAEVAPSRAHPLHV
jgi:hypothetical protein